MSRFERPSPVALLLGLLLLLTAVHADGVFQYVKSYNMSGGYVDLHPALLMPRTVYVDEQGLLYVSDYASKAGWVLNSSDQAVNRIPSGNANLLERPANVMKSGSVLYIADEGQGDVIAYISSGVFSTLGPAVSARRQPWAVWVDNQSMWLVEDWRDQVMGYNLQTGLLTDVRFGSGSGTEQLSGPKDLVADASHFYIADSGNNRIQIYDRNWQYVDTLGTGRGGLSLSGPTSLALDSEGRVYVSDTLNSRVVVFSKDGYVLGSLSGTDGGSPGLQNPVSVAVSGSTLYVLDSGTNHIYAYTMNWSSGVPQVLSDLDALNRSIALHQQQVLDVMDRINLSHAPFEASQSLAQAQDLANAGQYLEASQKIASASQALDAVRLQQRQALRTELQRRIDGFWAVIAPDKGLSVGNETAYRLTVVQNQIQTAQERLNNDDYPGTADLVLALQSDVPALQQQVDAWRQAQGQIATPVPDSGGANAMKSALKAQAAFPARAPRHDANPGQQLRAERLHRRLYPAHRLGQLAGRRGRV
ncbi:NHL repeat protein [uncultured archaeon]|nr:NHL repeat protein [uncultured archaeon]